MDWYGEVNVTASVDWGTVPAGLGFADSDPSREALGSTLNVISNGAYNLTVDSDSATWGTANLDATGACDTAQEFAIMVDIDDTMAGALQYLWSATGVRRGRIRPGAAGGMSLSVGR